MRVNNAQDRFTSFKEARLRELIAHLEHLYHLALTSAALLDST